MFESVFCYFGFCRLWTGQVGHTHMTAFPQILAKLFTIVVVCARAWFFFIYARQPYLLGFPKTSDRLGAVGLWISLATATYNNHARAAGGQTTQQPPRRSDEIRLLPQALYTNQPDDIWRRLECGGSLRRGTTLAHAAMVHCCTE